LAADGAYVSRGHLEGDRDIPVIAARDPKVDCAGVFGRGVGGELKLNSDVNGA